MFHKLKSGAVFIADSHFNSNRQELLHFLDNLPQGTKQLFLMGDIFDFLAPQIIYFTQKNQKVIDTINTLSKEIEVIYFEGNHDFNLKELFPLSMVIPRDQQAITFEYKNKKYLLSHGDLDMGFWYEFYTFFIRKPYFLKFLNGININNWFTKWVDTKLQNKILYHEFQDFETFAKKRLAFFSNMECDFIVEGHFHQGKEFEKYINLPTFSNNQYMVFEDGKFLNKGIL